MAKSFVSFANGSTDIHALLILLTIEEKKQPGQAVVLPAEGGQGQARGRRLLQLHPPDLEAAAGGDQEGGQGPCRPRRDLQHRSHGQADIESLVTKGTMTGMQI